MRLSSFIFPLALALTTLPIVAEGEEDGILVSGSGAVSAPPTAAVVTLGVSISGTTPQEALSGANRAVNQILAIAKEFSVNPRDVQTSNLSLGADYNAQRANLFRASNMVTVTIKAIDKAGEFIGRAVAGGATNLNGISFVIEDPTALRAQARERAVADARSKAEQLAQLGGVKLGPPVAITEVTGGDGQIPKMAFARVAAAESAVPLASGENEVRVEVTMRFAVVP